MVVRTGNMAAVVEDVSAALDRIAKLGYDLGGYVVSSQRWEEEQRLLGFLSVRVPAEHFDQAMQAIRGLAVEIRSETTSSQDVTEEYVDLKAKLQNLEATEKQLLKIMEKAETVQDILEVQRELSSVRGEIEQTKGRMQYLEGISAMSLIEVSLEQARLDVRFNADRTTAKRGEKLQFSCQVSGGFPPYSYEWDFGDGDISTIEAPVHAYKAAGSYTVSLKVSDDRGNTDIETRREYITVLPTWSAANIASRAWSGLAAFGRVLATVFIWIGIFSPVWLVIGGIVYWRRRSKKKRTGS